MSERAGKDKGFEQAKVLIQHCAKSFVGVDGTTVGFALATLVASFVSSHRSKTGTDNTEAYQRVTLEQHIELVVKMLPAMNAKLDEQRRRTQ